MVDDLLDVSRLTRGRVELRRERLDLVKLLRDAVAACQPIASRRGQRLVDELNAWTAELPVHGDATRLEQVFSNILDNATKYSRPGGEVNLAVELAPGAEQATVRIRDTGIGIPSDKLDVVFDMFRQLDTSLARARGGLGIGLTVVRQLVELHGGTVTAHSAGPDLGTEIRVELPLASKACTSIDPPVRSASAPARRQAPRRVLLVEDNPDTRELLQSVIETWGHTVVSASSGVRGLELALSNPPEVALIDLGLPEMDGLELARQLRSSPVGSQMKLVALTG